MKVEEFHEKFLMFQECVVAWTEELENDLQSLHEIAVPVTPKNVIRFPHNGKKRKPHLTPDRQG